jgi:hypothetical protein
MSARSDSGLRPDRLRRAVREATGQIDVAKRVAAAFAAAGGAQAAADAFEANLAQLGPIRRDGDRPGQQVRVLAVLLILSQPLHFIAFVILQNTYLDVAAAWLTAVGFGAAGLSLLRPSRRNSA